MTINRTVRLVAGLFILISLAPGAPASPLYVSSYWLCFSVFAGVNLFRSGLSHGWPDGDHPEESRCTRGLAPLLPDISLHPVARG